MEQDLGALAKSEDRREITKGLQYGFKQIRLAVFFNQNHLLVSFLLKMTLTPLPNNVHSPVSYQVRQSKGLWGGGLLYQGGVAIIFVYSHIFSGRNLFFICSPNWNFFGVGGTLSWL